MRRSDEAKMAPQPVAFVSTSPCPTRSRPLFLSVFRECNRARLGPCALLSLALNGQSTALALRHRALHGRFEPRFRFYQKFPADPQTRRGTRSAAARSCTPVPRPASCPWTLPSPPPAPPANVVLCMLANLSPGDSAGRQHQPGRMTQSARSAAARSFTQAPYAATLRGFP